MTKEEEESLGKILEYMQEHMRVAKINQSRSDYYTYRNCYEEIGMYFASTFIKLGFRTTYEE